MAGIYIHIPFCNSKCHYCNFFSTVSLKHKREIVEAISQEAVQRKSYLKDEEITTIYYGGGTPTALTNNELNSIHHSIIHNYPISKNAEITVEANPDDLNEKKLEGLKQMGVNRLSIGTQAFDDELLRKLNRRHTATQAIESIKLAQNAGFNNISIDLIYGIPELKEDAWKDEIQRATELGVTHISAYHLTVEPGTALEVLIRNKKYPPVNENQGMKQFEVLIEKLVRVGFEHYEISNFAINGKYSKHNTNYWKRKKYLGLGPSAHSYNLISREWNIANLQKYYQGIQTHNPIIEKEVLSPTDKYNEYVMLSLRTIWGVDLQFIESEFIDRKNSFIQTADEFIHKGLIKKEGACYSLTKKGKKLADGIAAEFFVV